MTERTSTREMSFLTISSTYVITFARLILILFPYFILPLYSDEEALVLEQSLYSPSLLSVLIRPHQTLLHLREARAIQNLSSNTNTIITSTKTSIINTNFAGAYLANNSIKIPPLLLAALSPLLNAAYPELVLSVLLLLVDLLIGYLLERIGKRLLLPKYSPNTTHIHEEETRQKQLPEIIQPHGADIFPIYSDNDDGGNSNDACENDRANTSPPPSISLSSLPLLAAQLYYWSPFTALPTSHYCCWQNLLSLLLLASISESCCSPTRGSPYTLSSFYLALATYLEPYYVVFTIPVFLLVHRVKDQPGMKTSIQRGSIAFLSLFVVWSICLQGLSLILVGRNQYWNVLMSIYGDTWLPSSPNLSLQWYFRMQLFSRFRNYFGAIFFGIPFILVGPFAIRFWKYPEVLIASFWMIWTIYRPIQVLYDTNVAFCLLLYCPKSLARMGSASFISLCSMMVPVILIVVDHWMWLEANNGNANFMFFQCLAYNVFLGVILGQFTSASMQRDKALRIDSVEYKAKKESHEKSD